MGNGDQKQSEKWEQNKTNVGEYCFAEKGAVKGQKDVKLDGIGF